MRQIRHGRTIKNDEFIKMWKEATVTIFEGLSKHLPKRYQAQQKSSAIQSKSPTKIRTGGLSNTNQIGNHKIASIGGTQWIRCMLRPVNICHL